MLSPTRTYEPRSFNQTLLHRCVSRYWPSVRDQCEAHGRPLPSFVRREFDSYLRCGDLKEVARLTALVPPPRMHRIHYFGLLAPNAKLRKFVVPEPPEKEDNDPCGHSIAYEQTTTGRAVRRRCP